ncbi:MAG: hypothetical protein HPY60_05090 [Candidatus Methanofastidiosum sp.]|nr:hypothetical protein [Methanofastidiosum sp.]
MESILINEKERYTFLKLILKQNLEKYPHVSEAIGKDWLEELAMYTDLTLRAMVLVIIKNALDI